MGIKESSRNYILTTIDNRDAATYTSLSKAELSLLETYIDTFNVACQLNDIQVRHLQTYLEDEFEDHRTNELGLFLDDVMTLIEEVRTTQDTDEIHEYTQDLLDTTELRSDLLYAVGRHINTYVHTLST